MNDLVDTAGSMPLAAAIKLIPVPDAPFYTYLTPWRQAPQIVISEGGTFSTCIGSLFYENPIHYCFDTCPTTSEALH